MIIEEGLQGAQPEGAAIAAAPALSSGVSVRVDEFVDQVSARSGLLREFMIEGRVFAAGSEGGPYLIDVSKPPDFGSRFKMFGIKQRDRQLFEKQNRLQLSGSPGEETQLMGWRFSSTESDVIPISIETSVSQDKRPAFWCEIDVRLKRIEFTSFVVTIPFKGTPEVTDCTGDVDILQRESALKWTPQFNGDENPTLEFRVESSNEDAFYPVTVQFEAETLYSELDISGVATQTGETVPHRVIKRFSARRFQIT
jgi:hypothetical protein